MCLRHLRVRDRLSSLTVQSVDIPCGVCADCRKAAQDAWRFRLRYQINHLRTLGYQVGFLTLTFDDAHLPRLPAEVFKRPEQIRPQSCFSKPLVQDWIHRLKGYLQYHYGYVKDRRLEYFVCSEYGSVTRRPHHHAILAWPGDGQCGYDVMHALCARFWPYGFIAPRHWYGDRKCRAFAVDGDVDPLLSYLSKYVCKDLDYGDTVADLDLWRTPRGLPEDSAERALATLGHSCLPFHCQSTGFGFEPFRALTDADKLKMLLEGCSFVGDDRLYELPLYIRNRLLFDYDYFVGDDGERKVRRVASRFFESNRERIFEERAKYYDRHLAQMTRAYLEQSGVSAAHIDRIAPALDELRARAYLHYGDDLLFGQYYLAYKGVQSDRCYDIPLCEQWMLRYRDPRLVDAESREWPLADVNRLSYLCDYWEYVNLCYSYVGVVNLPRRAARERLLKKIVDFYSAVRRR